MNECYITFKLITGEQLLGEVTNQNDFSITVMNPFIVTSKTGINSSGQMIEQVGAQPYCSYSAEPDFTFELKHIMFIKPLKSDVIQKYLSLVHEINMREMLQNDVDEYLDTLEALLGKSSEENPHETEEEQYDNSIHFLEGNDTVH